MFNAVSQRPREQVVWVAEQDPAHTDASTAALGAPVTRRDGEISGPKASAWSGTKFTFAAGADSCAVL